MERQPEKRRTAIYEYVVAYYRNHGYGPSMREIGKQTGTSVAMVHYHVGHLVEAGFLLKTPGISRSIRPA